MKYFDINERTHKDAKDYFINNKNSKSISVDFWGFGLSSTKYYLKELPKADSRAQTTIIIKYEKELWSKYGGPNFRKIMFGTTFTLRVLKNWACFALILSQFQSKLDNIIKNWTDLAISSLLWAYKKNNLRPIQTYKVVISSSCHVKSRISISSALDGIFDGENMQILVEKVGKNDLYIFLGAP